MSGHVAQLIALLAEPMCLPCLTMKTGLTAAETSNTLRTMSATLQLSSSQGLCHACGETRAVLALDALPVPKPPVPRRATVRNTLLAFIRAHRGEFFCASCLMAAAQTARADIPIRELEGLGVVRRQRPCSRCGAARRLTSGLPA